MMREAHCDRLSGLQICNAAVIWVTRRISLNCTAHEMMNLINHTYSLHPKIVIAMVFVVVKVSQV